MRKITIKLVEEMQLSWDYGQGFHTDSIVKDTSSKLLELRKVDEKRRQEQQQNTKTVVAPIVAPKPVVTPQPPVVVPPKPVVPTPKPVVPTPKPLVVPTPKPPVVHTKAAAVVLQEQQSGVSISDRSDSYVLVLRMCYTYLNPNTHNPRDEDREEGSSSSNMPAWAQKANLKKALAIQFSKDNAINPVPSVFPEFSPTCDLEATFRTNERKPRFTRRSSSSAWQHDKATKEDRESYRRDMGYLGWIYIGFFI